MNSITIVGTIASKIIESRGQYGCYIKDDDLLFYVWMKEGIIKKVKANALLNKGTDVVIVGRLLHTFQKNDKTIITVGAYKISPLVSIHLKNNIVSKPKKKNTNINKGTEKIELADEDGNDIIPLDIRDIVDQSEGEA